MTDLYQARAAVAKALAHPTRLQIIDILSAHGETCVCEIAAQMEQGQSTISKHLAVLRDAGLLASRKEGLMVFYSLRVQCVSGFFACLDKVLLTDLEQKRALLSVEEIE